VIDERQKASKILEELLDYFFRNGVTDLNMSLNFQGDQVRIHVSGPCEKEPDDFNELHDLLNATRRPELEGYYYELLGSSVGYGELKLLGSLIDHAETQYEDQILSVTAYRLLHQS
jgi:hypothetical protein